MSKITNYLYEKFDDFKIYCLFLLIYIIEFFDNQYDKLTNRKRDKWYDQ